MPVVPLSTEQRQALNAYGTPLSVFDDVMKQHYMLLHVTLSPSAIGGVRASLESLNIVAEADTEDEALVTLAYLIGAYKAQ